MTSVMFPRAVSFEQSSDYDCGSASVRSIFASLTGVIIEEEAMKERLHVTKERGTNTQEIKKFFEEEKLRVIEREHATIDQIERDIRDGMLCLVVYQAWGTEEEYAKLESGHYSVIYGVDGTTIDLIDPSVHEDGGLGVGRRKMEVHEFEKNWTDKDENKVYDRWCLSVGVKK